MTRNRAPSLIVVALDVLRARREGPAGIDRRKRERWAALFTHARLNSPVYQRLYAHLPAGIPNLADLPPVSKQQLMGSFDDWACDPAVTLADVHRFISDPTRIGMLYLGKYFVCSSSGTTGHPGIFVHDLRALPRLPRDELPDGPVVAVRTAVAAATLPPRPVGGGCRNRRPLRGRGLDSLPEPAALEAPPEPCPCGSPLPAIRVEGRCDDVLRLRGTGGRTVAVAPLGIGSVLDEVPGVVRSQLVQTGPSSLTLRLDVDPESSPQQVWDQACTRLADYLATQGLSDIHLVRAAESPECSATSDKFRQVIAASEGLRSATTICTGTVRTLE